MGGGMMSSASFHAMHINCLYVPCLPTLFFLCPSFGIFPVLAHGKNGPCAKNHIAGQILRDKVELETQKNMGEKLSSSTTKHVVLVKLAKEGRFLITSGQH